MNYREERKQALIRYLSQSGVDYKMDGVHTHVLDKKCTDANIVQSVRDLDYKTRFNKNGTIISISNSAHEFKLDFRANNLTSSSMLSACFFAQKVENQQEFKKLIASIFAEKYKRKIDIQSDIDVELEWENKEWDKSHIDARMEFQADGDTFQIFAEVKYCEPAYGPKKIWEKKDMDEQQRKEARDGYIQHCKSCYQKHRKRLSIDGFMDKCNDFEECKNSKYSQRYQIIRNVSHASLESNDYCWFLLAKENKEAVADILGGLDDLRDQNRELLDKRVAVIFFEDIVDKDSDLYQKYFQN